MKSSVYVSLALLLAVNSCEGFSASSFTGATISRSTVSNGDTLSMEYIPSGMSKEQWKKVKEAESKKKQGKNLGAVGITSFKSRSFSEWQAAGGKNLFPVNPNDVKDKKDIPYMQRPGGSADDDDLKKKKNPFSMFAPKKKTPAPEPTKPASTNWWTL